MKEIHVDGGAFVGPPDYRFHDAYFSVCDSEGNLIHFEKNIGDVWSGIAEYEAIKWAIENIIDRPLKIYSDCTTAIGWARHGKKKPSSAPNLHGFTCSSLLQGDGVIIKYLHGNFADQWNAKNHSPKKDKSFYIKRYKRLGENSLRS